MIRRALSGPGPGGASSTDPGDWVHPEVGPWTRLCWVGVTFETGEVIDAR